MYSCLFAADFWTFENGYYLQVSLLFLSIFYTSANRQRATTRQQIPEWSSVVLDTFLV